MTQLTEKVKQLIIKARIVSFASWENTHPQAAIEIFQMADDKKNYLTDEDLQQIQVLSPQASEFIPVAKLLRDNAGEIVDESRKQVLAQMPGIIEPGGGLYPPERASACWRDLWNFLRCITYGIAGKHTDYTSDTGFHYMNLLYQELEIPLNAMILGLESIKNNSLRRCSMIEPQDNLGAYFDTLIVQLANFPH